MNSGCTPLTYSNRISLLVFGRVPLGCLESPGTGEASLWLEHNRILPRRLAVFLVLKLTEARRQGRRGGMRIGEYEDDDGCWHIVEDGLTIDEDMFTWGPFVSETLERSIISKLEGRTLERHRQCLQRPNCERECVSIRA